MMRVKSNRIPKQIAILLLFSASLLYFRYGFHHQHTSQPVLPSKVLFKSFVSDTNNTSSNKTEITDERTSGSIDSRLRLNSIGYSDYASSKDESMAESENEAVSIEDPMLLVDTPGCKLPRTNITPEFFQDLENWRWRESKVPNCDEFRQFVPFVQDDEIVELTHYDPKQCQMWEIQRMVDNDCDFQIVPRGRFEGRKFDVSTMEMFMAECDGMYDFGATLPIHPEVEAKLEYWKDIKDDDRPISFLLIGLESTSRSHLLRSFPRTIKVMQDMGFEDFKGFHSFESNTLANILPLLTGLTKSKAEASCWVDWWDPFDSCPFIWNTCKKHKYVTLYLEDGSQSFNWFGCGGFKEKPTDYYIHPFFKAIMHYRENVSSEAADCVSSETVLSFMLRYQERFLEKFQSVPFFDYFYTSNPLHDFELALPNMDAGYERFLLYLKAYPGIHENTLILLFGDHGERYGEFPSHGGIEPFVERSLVPLFIRLPEKLLRKYPDSHFLKHLRRNTNLLTTAMDVHHTLLHLLTLSRLSSQENHSTNFMPALNDRSSLLLEVSKTRTCSSLYITADSCVCNAISQVSVIQNPFYMQEMLEFCIHYLNELVEESRFRERCQEWEAAAAPIISADALQQGDNFADVLFKFTAMPGAAQFEIRLKVLHTSDMHVMDIKKVGDLIRINTFGNTSQCIKPQDDDDKFMMSFCYCKEEE